jgi:hypothetical protein
MKFEYISTNVSEKHAASRFRVEYYLEDGDRTFMTNVGTYLPNYKTSLSRRKLSP